MVHVIAFDVSKGKSTMVIYNSSQRCIYEGELEHTAVGFAWLKEQIEVVIKEVGQKPEIVFEATGVYSMGLQSFLQEEGYSYTRMNPLHAKLQMMTGSMRRNKTDISDAHELAKSHFRVERYETFVQDDYFEQMRALGRYYDDIEQEIQQYSSRLHSFLQLSFPSLEKTFSNSSLHFLKIVQLYPHPELLLNLSLEELKDIVKKTSLKNISLQQAEEKAALIITAAHSAYPAIKATDVRCQHLKECARRIVELKQQKKGVIKQMVQLSKERTDFQVLKSFPGIGETTAVRLIGEMGDIRRFKNNKQINAYAGIDIQRHQSGNIEYRDRINKRGNRRLRKILYFMIFSMISLRKNTNNTIVEYYDRLKKQPQSKPHKVAMIACVNKFLKVAFHLIQNETHYSYELASL